MQFRTYWFVYISSVSISSFDTLTIIWYINLKNTKRTGNDWNSSQDVSSKTVWAVFTSGNVPEYHNINWNQFEEIRAVCVWFAAAVVWTQWLTLCNHMWRVCVFGALLLIDSDGLFTTSGGLSLGAAAVMSNWGWGMLGLLMADKVIALEFRLVGLAGHKRGRP